MRRDGCLGYHGRVDFEPKVRGHRVDTAAVESGLLTLPSIADAVRGDVGDPCW